MRSVIQVSGSERLSFLNRLITQDVPETGLGYGALLTPQGKYLADFFVWSTQSAIFLDVSSALAADLAKRLTLYRLRADVQIALSDLKVSRGLGEMPSGAMLDPRHPQMGWRAYGESETYADLSLLQVTHGIPETGVDLLPNDSFILEMGFERLNGVSFKKGCYVGQEINARMKHKTELRKGLATITVLDGAVQTGDEITVDEKSAGRIGTVAGNQALAYLRFDRAQAGEMKTEQATLTLAQRWV